MKWTALAPAHGPGWEAEVEVERIFLTTGPAPEVRAVPGGPVVWGEEAVAERRKAPQAYPRIHCPRRSQAAMVQRAVVAALPAYAELP